MNRRGDLVLSQKGILQGPYLHSEWLQQSYHCLDLFDEVLKDEGKHRDWRDVYFRCCDDYYAGSYSHFTQIWEIFINGLPDNDKLKHECLYNLHHGVDFYRTLTKVKKVNPRKFRRREKLYTEKEPHYLNRKILETCDPEEGDMGYYKSLFPQYKWLPKKVGQRGNLKFKDNPLNEPLEPYISKQLADWCVCGSVLDGGHTSHSTPYLTVGITVANATKKPRLCFDGGALKALEGDYKIPCILDGIPQFYKYLHKGALLSKVDDKSGYHQLRLNKESLKGATQKWGNRYFYNFGAVWGAPSVAAEFQRMNNIPVTFLRNAGVNINLYLDDRGIVDNHEFIRKDEFHATRNSFLTALILVAAGGFLSLGKTELEGKTKMEFLGMEFDTIAQTITIPDRKWEKFCEAGQKIISSELVLLKDLERFRGRAISFLEVITKARLYIRQMTNTLVKTEKANQSHFKPDQHLIEEITWWITLKHFRKTRSWAEKPATHLEVKNVYTDSSSFAGGAVIKKESGELTDFRTVYWTLPESKTPIHIKEALIIEKALDLYEGQLKNKKLLIFTDNSAVFHASKHGCSDPALNRIIVAIHHKAYDLNSELFFTLVSTHDQLADAPSREIDLAEEIIEEKIFEKITKKWNIKPTIDCMAAPWNTKCEKYISKIYYKGCYDLDFLTCPNIPKDEILWIFPPKSFSEKSVNFVLKNYLGHKWILIFHRFQEWPCYYTSLLNLRTCKMIRLGTQSTPSTCIPAKKKNPDRGNYNQYYKPNKMPFETWAVLHDPNLHIKLTDLEKIGKL